MRMTKMAGRRWRGRHQQFRVGRQPSLLRLIRPPGKIEGGQVLLDGLSLLELPEERMRQPVRLPIQLVVHHAASTVAQRQPAGRLPGNPLEPGGE